MNFRYALLIFGFFVFMLGAASLKQELDQKRPDQLKLIEHAMLMLAGLALMLVCWLASFLHLTPQ